MSRWTAEMQREKEVSLKEQQVEDSVEYKRTPDALLRARFIGDKRSGSLDKGNWRYTKEKKAAEKQRIEEVRPWAGYRFIGISEEARRLPCA